MTFTRSHLLTDTNNTVLQNNSSVKLCSNSQNSDFILYMVEVSAAMTKLNTIPVGTVKLMRTSIGLLVWPKSMRSIIGATRQEQRHGSA
ncbi:hypothetical protein N8128_01580 [Paracoccaceae bacterium]|nr:hypothetical protein [Paracoccaceae bacterium]